MWNKKSIFYGNILVCSSCSTRITNSERSGKKYEFCEQEYSKENPKFIKNENELKILKLDNYYSFNCISCGIFNIKYHCRETDTLFCMRCSHKNQQKRQKEDGTLDKALQKRKNTNIKKYGVENYSQTKEGKEKLRIKAIENNQQKFLNSDLSKEKREKTFLEKYGSKTPFENKEFQLKALEKGQNSSNHYHKIIYENIGFDSSWEVICYKYFKKLGKNIIRNQNKFFIYYVDNKEFKYFPDFIIDDEFYEVKGPQFFENGKMINPYNRNEDKKYQAKYECMVTNKVHILLDKDIEKFEKELKLF